MGCFGWLLQTRRVRGRPRAEHHMRKTPDPFDFPMICLVAVALGFFALGCGSPSTEDTGRVAELQRVFGDKYEFALYEEFYLNARLKHGATGAQDDAERIYKTFHNADATTGKIRPTSYVYLNMYDANGKFLSELFFDPKTQALVRSNVEHH
jgi:hypothetical protein